MTSVLWIQAINHVEILLDAPIINTFMSHRAFKYRLKPTPEQEQTLAKWFGCARWIWNRMLEANIVEYQNTKKFIWSHQFHKTVIDLKKQHEWLKSVPSQALQQKCDDLNQALKMTSKKRAKRFGFPKFKSRRANTQSIRIPQQNGHIKPRKQHIQIPKMGAIAWVCHRPFEGKLKSVTVKRHNGKFYAVVLCEVEDTPKHLIDRSQTVGIDLGLTTFAVLSDAQEIATPRYYRRAQQKLRQAQQKLSRKQKGSRNRAKAIAELRRIHEKVVNQRHNFIHQQSRRIANSYSGVYVEDLDIKAIKRRFGKSTSDQGWAQFVSALEYKCNHLGRIDRWAASTKTCSKCGTVHDLTLADREMSCSCGHVQSRDLNAARNIRVWGQMATDPQLFATHTPGTGEIHACGDKISALDTDLSTKQEKFFVFDKEAVTSLASQ